MTVAPSQVISLRLALAGFAESWSHCGAVADYVARYAASDRFDPEGLTTRLSSFLNEVLELIYANHGADRGGAKEGPPVLAIDVTREESALHVACAHNRLDVVRLLHVACALPADDAVASAFERALAGLDDPDLRSRYRDGFDAGLDEARVEAPFLEMAGVHGIAPVLNRSGDHVVVRLTIPAE